ncbi:MAG TPA: hypothetical protein DCQ29_12675 [Chitinophagaceae bacterium]|nr:hypothetical protein [Chitinophagaceae bacterium]
MTRSSLHWIRHFLQNKPFLRQLVGYYAASSGLMDKHVMKYPLSGVWKSRIADVLACKDNAYIPRCENAGDVVIGKQILCNGIKIHLGSYYGAEYSQMLFKNKGVHEPQEERVFKEVLKLMPNGATMIEMGAFWSFYSMWFNKCVPAAKNFMIEPDSFNMGNGKRNFNLNNMNGKFIQAFIADTPVTEGPVPAVTIDSIIASENIGFVHVLHSDIQGYEHKMLHGAVNAFNNKKIGYVFISTHSQEVHEACREFLKSYQFSIIAEADMKDTFSEDGLIAAQAPYVQQLPFIQLDLKTKQ